MVVLKSFSLVAAHLSLRQPTVSAHVHELEERLGSKVMNRAGRKISLTALGQVLFDRAKELLALKRETLAALDGFQDKVKGDLLVGGSNIPGEYILPGKLGGFIHKYPEVKPVLRIGDSAGIVEAVLDGRVELGYVGFKGEDSRLSFQKIWKDEMVLAVPKSHSWTARRLVDLKDLRQGRFISRERGSGTLRSILNLLGRKGQDPAKLLNVTMELGSTAAIKEAIVAGLGVSILSRTSIRREIKDGLLKEVTIRGFKLERDFYQVYHRHRIISPISQAFIHYIKQHG